MPDWLGLDWWRYAWAPTLAAGLVWLASTWKSTGETRTARDARLDGRQDKELARLDAEVEDLRRDNERVQDLARAAEQFAHDQRHGYLDVVSALIALRRLVVSFLDGSVDREKLQRALTEQGDPVIPPKVPPLQQMAAKRPE